MLHHLDGSHLQDFRDGPHVCGNSELSVFHQIYINVLHEICIVEYVCECLLTVHKPPAGDVTGEPMRQHLARVGEVGDLHVAIVIHRFSQSQESNVISNRQKQDVRAVLVPSNCARHIIPQHYSSVAKVEATWWYRVAPTCKCECM